MNHHKLCHLKETSPVGQAEQRSGSGNAFLNPFRGLRSLFNRIFDNGDQAVDSPDHLLDT